MSAQESLEPPDETIARLTAENVRLTRGIDLIGVDLTNAEASLRIERRKVTELRQLLEDKAVGTDFAPEIQTAFDYWRRRCAHPRAKLGTERANAVKARLKAGHSLVDVLRAIDGAAFDAFVAENGKRYDELELVCRNEVKFDGFVDRWRATIEHGKLSAALNAYCLPAGESSAALSFEHGGWRWKCPVCALRCDVGRKAWEQDVLWLTVGRGFVYCAGACVGLTVEMIRGALLEGFPMVAPA